jgi:hypothetical protein
VVVVVMWFVVHMNAPSVVAATNVVAPEVVLAVVMGSATAVVLGVVSQLLILCVIGVS